MNKHLWMRTIVTLAVCLSIVACGKSKKSSDVVPDRTVVKAPPATSEKKDGVPTPKEQKDGTGAAPAPDTDSKGNTVDPHRRSPPGGTQTKPGENDGTTRPSPTPSPAQPAPGQPQVPPASPTPAPPVQPSTPPSQNDGENSNSGHEDADANSLVEESRKYSGSAKDALREYLTYKQEKISDENQKLSNLKFANSITGVLMNLDAQSNRIDVSLYTGSDQEPMRLQGYLNSEHKAQLFSSIEGLDAAVTCMDAGSTCETRVLIVRFGDAKIPIIYRKTNLSFSSIFPEKRCTSGECEEFYTMFRRTEMNVRDRYTLKLAKMESYEVIQGRSAFKVIGITNGGEIFKIAGPLPNPKRYPELDLLAERKLTTHEMIEPKTRQVLGTRLNESLGEVRIVENDGRGLLTFTVEMKPTQDGKRDKFELQVSRRTAPIRTILEEN